VSVAADTHIGAVRLRVADIDALTAFYERVIGLRTLARENGLARLGVDDGAPLVELVAAPGAPARPAVSTGLFHLAILVPARRDLAGAILRVSGAGWRLTGASDHLVSEALYLNDPEGNGIELYRDRPRDEWRHGPGGELEMATLPLDLRDVLGERVALGADVPDPMPPGTRMGHVHLQVSGLDAAERFYAGELELDVMVRSYPGALFVSAGGYHHHIGLNTWQSAGAPAPPEGALGLDRFELVLPDTGERDRLAASLEEAGSELIELEAGVRASDPSGSRVLLTTRPG
jgi:catechol 2,3-dioxygenase